MKFKHYIASIFILFIGMPLFMAGQGVILSSGIYIKLSGGTLILNDGNWVNNGNYYDQSGKIILNGTSQQEIGGSSSTQFKNMTINNPAGVIGSHDFAIDGILDLSSANASAFQGTLDMGVNTLTMGASATTIGAGDVTGIVNRTSFVSGNSYSFGNQFTTINFQNTGTLPAEVGVKITMGSEPAWKTGAVKRTYDIIRTGAANGSFAAVRLHYLNSEVNGNTENQMVFWDAHLPSPPGDVDEHGRSGHDVTNNWVEIAIFDITYFPTAFGSQNWTLGNSLFPKITWNGSVSTVWANPDNWTPGGVPSDLSDVVIPNASTTSNDPILSTGNVGVGRIEIVSGGILNSPATCDFTINGGTGAWVDNQGTFNAGSGEVIFTNPNPTISGTTDFYDVTIPDTVVLWLTNESIMRIAGAITNNGIWRVVYGGPTTVEYNGGNQTVVVPNPATNRYSTLILSGSGTKTMPGTALDVYGDFAMSGTTTATAGNRIRTAGNFTIGSGAAFTTGAFSDSIGGNFSNSGTFTATGSTITLNGAAAQTIGGTTATTFNNLISANASGATVTSDALTTVAGTLTINSGKKFSVAPGKQLTAAGTMTNNAGASGFVLESDAEGTASLLHNTDDVPGIAQRYISGVAEAWHFISSPVDAQEISGTWLPSGTYGNGTGYDLYVWNEPTSCWIYKNDSTSAINWNTVHPGSDFTAGRGYLYSVQAANPTKEFAGNLNNGTVIYGLNFSSADLSLKGFNLVGNPYPSSIDWQASSGWTRSSLVSTGGGYDMWIWNPAANNYGVFNSFTGIGTNDVTRYIAPMQGYFVQTAGAGNLTLNNDIRVHDAGPWFKNAGISPGMVSVVVKSESDQKFDQVNLLFGYPLNQPGAKKLFSRVTSAPGLFMPSGGEYYSVRYLTDTTDNPVVPVMFKPGVDGDYAITCNFNVDDFKIVMLEDLQHHHIQDMKTSTTYRFQSSASDDASRFILHFGPGNEAAYDELPARIYTDGTYLIIDLTLVGKETEAYVCDVLGRLLLKKSFQGLTKHRLDINAKSQIIMVYLRNPQGKICRKLFYNQ